MFLGSKGFEETQLSMWVFLREKMRPSQRTPGSRRCGGKLHQCLYRHSPGRGAVNILVSVSWCFYSHFKSYNIVSLKKCKASKVQDIKQSFNLYAEGSLPAFLFSLCQATCLLTHLLLTSWVTGNKRRRIKERSGMALTWLMVVN